MTTAPEHLSSKGRSTRKEILAAAVTVFTEKGYLKARITDIADEAGLSHGAVYRYFKDKREIMLHVAQDFLARSTDEIHVPFNPADPAESIYLSNERYLKFFASEMKIFAVLHQAGQADTEVEALRLRYSEDWFARIERMLDRGKSLGIVQPDIDIRLVSILLGGMVQGFAYHAYSGKSGFQFPPDHVASEITKIWERSAFVSIRRFPQ